MRQKALIHPELCLLHIRVAEVLQAAETIQITWQYLSKMDWANH